MSGTIILFVTIGVAIALIAAFLALIVDAGTNRRLRDVKRDLKEQVQTLADLKAVVARVDYEYLKKILTKVSDNETEAKKLHNLLDLLDEKVRSYINRQNARLPRPKTDKDGETAPAGDPSQQDLIEQLKAHGMAQPLGQPAVNNQVPLKRVRASEVERARTG